MTVPGLGTLPGGHWDAALTHFTQRGYSVKDMLDAGLISQRDSGGHYDRFRNRLMFPIRDQRGRVIAFGGRVLPGSQDPAKYLNSPETPLTQGFDGSETITS